jgi:hypothetical protein
MALVSPGVEVSVVDESQYLPASTNSVPYLLIATAQNKVSGTGTGVATGTTAANANKVQLVTSQRELATLYGNPFFYSTTNGTPLNGYELNEYGLLAAHSVLGVSNRAYVQRVDVDLAALSARLTRPVGDANNNSYWLDTAETLWGLFEWNKATGKFTNKVPHAITSTDDLTGGVPKSSVGAVGDYAVVTTNASNPVYYKKADNTWVLVGSDDWQNAHYSVQSGTTNPVLTPGQTIVINGTTVTATGTTVTSLASDINSNGITGITAAAVDGKLEIYADSDVTPEGSSADGAWTIANGTGTLLTALSITAGTYYAPEFTQAKHTQLPRWKTTDTAPRPTGSLWQKTTSVNQGANLVVKKYNESTDTWATLTVPLYADDATANKELDPAGGGRNISAGVVYGYLDWSENYTATLKLHVRSQTGDTTVTSSEQSPTMTNADAFTISASVKNSTTMSTPVTATLAGTTIQDYAAAFNAANVANTVASVTDGYLTIKHTQGGVIKLTDTVGTPTVDAFGVATPADVTGNARQTADGNSVLISNWNTLTYEAKTTEPTQDPANGTLWYHSAIDEVDIMIHDGSTWKGYRNVTNDVRGFDLSNTDASGCQVSASAPTTQSDETALAYGDLWLDTSDLENYPLIKRWEAVDGVDQWVTIDNTDQTTENGIVFADARWSTADVDPVTGDIATIKSLALSNNLDLDAPSDALYPAGTLLFNTRRSGYTVKQYKVNYFNSTDFEGSLPTNKDAWVTVSGNKADGSPYMGRKAQRQMVVAALKAGIDSNTDIREEQRQFNLLAAPGYPELMQNMVALNNDRNNTGFIIGDTPFRLTDNSEEIINWATDAGGTGADGEDGLATNDPYSSAFYPSARANDLSGNAVVVPASHAVLRTFIRNDEVGYPWLAPAGNRRGLIDNVTALGYVDAQTSEFVQVANRESVRDTLYENRVNPLTFVPGAGLTNYGNKTLGGSTSALDRINVARLVAYLREKLEAVGKAFMFEPNDTITRNEVKNAVEQLLNDVTAKRGIYDYLVVCDETNNTPARIDRNELYVDIAIEPTKAVEFIYIPVRIKNTGEIEAGNL